LPQCANSRPQRSETVTNAALQNVAFEESADDVLDGVPCGVISTLPDGTIIHANDTFAAWAGQTREALLAGQRFQDLLTVPGRIFYETHFAPLLLMQGFLKEIACQLKRMGGDPLHVLVSSYLKLDPAGEPLVIRTAIFDATDRVKYEEELRRTRSSTQQLAAIVTSSRDAIVSVGLDDVVRSWNPGATSLFGYTEAEAVGRTVDELIVPEDVRAVRLQNYEKLRSGETVVIKDTLRYRKDRNLVQIEITASPMRDAEGRVTAASLIFRDISERKAASAALRKSEIRYRRLFEAAHDGVLLLDPETRKITDANPFMTALLGYTPNQLIGMELYEIGFFADAQASQDMFQILKAARQVRYENLPLQNQDGNVREVEVVANLYDEDGRPVIQCNVRDITERKEAENALHISEERLRLAAKAAGFGVYEHDPITRQSIWSSELFAIMGLEPRERVEMSSLIAAVHPDDRDVYENFLQEPADEANDGLYEHSYRILRPNGEVRWVTEKGRAEFAGIGENRREIKTRGTIVDVTQRKQHEEHAELLMKEVNHRAKNLLAVVQAIARQTARTHDPSTFAIHLSERIRGLAASQDLLVKNQWKGVSVSDLVRAQLTPFTDLIGTRVLMDGPPAHLSSGAAQGIGMALHELATNAAKYGALSSANGRVRINWDTVSTPEPLFTMQWLEEDGPAVVPPNRKGFGHMVIERMAADSVDGKVEIEYRESGVHWKLSAPLSKLIEA
jgi:PAS domain S-box-containing protein